MPSSSTSFSRLTAPEKEQVASTGAWDTKCATPFTNEWADKCQFCLQRELPFLGEDDNSNQVKVSIANRVQLLEALRPKV